RIGSYHSLPSLHQFALKNQTPETPNTLAIWLLAGVIEDFLRKGIQTIRRETEYKAAILYQALDQHPLVKPFVSENQWRSKTVIVAQTGNHTQRVSEHLSGRGLLAGDGYGPGKGNQLRFANFPTHSKEQYEWLVDSILDFKG
ncbi:MAG TPA: phosphoserine aminotransferase, partial [Cytophagales bacterium]|nr:phosphoserine aminotransferase [Cytophagales bacterium]